MLEIFKNISDDDSYIIGMDPRCVQDAHYIVAPKCSDIFALLHAYAISITSMCVVCVCGRKMVFLF